MRTLKVFTGTLKTDLNEGNLKGKTLRLEFESNNNVIVLTNNDTEWQIDNLTTTEVYEKFEYITFLKSNVWLKV
jgi:hypothetical protein